MQKCLLFHSYFCDAGVPWFRAKKCCNLSVKCCSAALWPRDLLAFSAPLRRHATQVSGLQSTWMMEGMRWLQNQHSWEPSWFFRIVAMTHVGVKSTYLRHTMSHQHGHTYNLCPKQVDLGWCVIKANWLMHHQVSKSVVYHTNTHLQVDPNNTYIHCADEICAIALFPSSCVAMLAAPAILL